MSDVPSDLSFGVMCNGTVFADWQAVCIDRLREVENTTLELLIVDDHVAHSTTEGSRKNLGLAGSECIPPTNVTKHRALWERYVQAFGGPACLSETDLTDELDSVERIRCRTQMDGEVQRFTENDVRRIDDYELDFVIQFAFGTIEGNILDVPEYGVWSFHHGNKHKSEYGPPGFWEIYDGDAVTEAVLERLTDGHTSQALRKGYFSTNQYSYAKNINNVCYGTTAWPVQAAIDILNGNGVYGAPLVRVNGSQRGVPSPLQLLSYNLKRGYALGKALVSGTDQWNIGVLEAPIDACLDGSASPDISWCPQPRENGFVADPFPITIDDTTYIFVEDFSYADSKGRISFIEYPHGFEAGNVRIAHEEPFHMSYPYLFKHDDKIYATPEMHEANEIRLYRVVRPSEWEVESVLVDGIAGIDPTLVEYNGRWWMFYTEKAYDNTKLYLRYADSLTGEWKPHENNPVKTDVRSARPGGTPFVRNEDLYRPSQYSAGEYGRRVVVNRVNELSATRFSEEKVCEMKPTKVNPYPDGMHTLSSRGNLTLVDGKRKVRNEYALRQWGKQVLSSS